MTKNYIILVSKEVKFMKWFFLFFLFVFLADFGKTTKHSCLEQSTCKLECILECLQ